MWLNKAFDQYVLEDADLETVLAEADQMAKSYRDCASGIPEVDLAELDTQESSLAYYRQFIDCAVGLDPSLKETFSYYYEETD
jgi:hypothetical protein